MTHIRVAIRPAEKADLTAIVRLFSEDELLGSRSSVASSRDAGAAGAELQPPAHAVSDTHVAAFEVISEDPNNTVYVAEAGAGVVGTFQLTFIRQLSYGGCLVAQVESVFVDASARSLGVGAKMMAFARQEAERRGALRLQLTSNLKRERAHRFYEKLGYRATHKGMKLYLQPPSRKAEV